MIPALRRWREEDQESNVASVTLSLGLVWATQHLVSKKKMALKKRSLLHMEPSWCMFPGPWSVKSCPLGNGVAPGGHHH